MVKKITVLFFAVLLLPLIGKLYAQTPSSVLFSDDFDSNDLSGYQQLGGTWTTVSQSGRGFVLRHRANSRTIIFLSGGAFTGSYEVRAEIWNEDNDEAGLAFRVNTADGDNFYNCSATADNNFNAGLWRHVNDRSGTPTTALAVTPWTYVRQRWYTVTVTVDQGTINCIWESQESGVELDVTAVDPNPSEGGSVGIWLSSQDNFRGDLLEVVTLGPPDTEPPVLNVAQPQANTDYNSSFDLNYTVSDNVGLSGCSYKLDGISTALPSCQGTTLTSLTLGDHEVQVFATDTSNNTGESPLINFTVNADTTPPQWSPVPENQTVMEGQSLTYQVNAIDNVDVDSYSIDDTSNFTINALGLLQDNVPLAVGTYPLTISVRDIPGNENVASITVTVVDPAAGDVPPPDFKVAFIGDQGSGSNARDVLQLILDEGAELVVHQGDFEYNNDPDEWDQMINSILGSDFPYFASIGNHDDSAWNGYQQKLYDRLARINGASCSGDLGVKSSCSYQGLFFILSGVGVSGSGHESYIRDQLSQTNSLWRICSWHKNMKEMQIGGKSDSTGWGVYEACKDGGAIIATAHEHSYERTKTLINMENQTVDPQWPAPDDVRLAPGASFVFVSGLGGRSIRDQERCSPDTPPYGCNGEWASIYSSNQGANYGALFCSFNVNGQPNAAHCYFKDIDGNVPDEFDITSFVPGLP